MQRDLAAEETPGLPSSPRPQEADSEPVVVAETLEDLMKHKTVKKHRDKLNKKLDELQKEFEKKKNELEEELGIVKAKPSRAPTRLIKRISSKNLYVSPRFLDCCHY